MIELFNTYFYIPFYNFLLFLVGIVPGGDVGIAVIIATLFVKIVTLPLTISAFKTQLAMKIAEPKLKEIREKYKKDKERQVREMLAVYKEYKLKPFSSILAALIQIPVLLAVFLVFQQEKFPEIATNIVYSFIGIPETISNLFLGLIPLNESSIALALIAGLAQYLHAKISITTPSFNIKEIKKGEAPSMQEEFQRAIGMQMRYILPLIIGVVAYTSGAVALYFITQSLFSIGQEHFLKKTNDPTQLKTS